VCPECNAIDSFSAAGNDFICSECDYDIHINDYGFFERLNEGKLHFDNIRDWYNWQEQWLLKDVSDKFDAAFKAFIFEDRNSEIYHTSSDKELDFVGVADVKMFIDRIEIKFIENDHKLILNFDELQTINPQINDRLEIYYNNHAYRIIGSRPGVSALKWEVAVNAIWKKLEYHTKLAPYISQ
jgi:hypothetical protein